VGSGDGCLWGTHHKTPDPEKQNNIGVLFLSGGVLPRAATGDSAVYWADALARCGYPSFRFDLPGMGDSDGDLARTENEFLSAVNAGVYGTAVSGIASRLVERFNLSGVVVIGHCSGAVAALYAASADRCIKGLILLNPSFHAQKASEAQDAWVRWQLHVLRKLAWDRPAQSSLRDAGVKLLAYIRTNIYRRWKSNRLLARPKELPGMANLSLVRCWKHLASAGFPILVLRSPVATPKAGEFDYVRDLYPLSESGCRISAEQIDGASHAFAERGAKDQVLKHAEPWLSACFPLRGCAETQTADCGLPQFATATPGVSTNVR